MSGLWSAVAGLMIVSLMWPSEGGVRGDGLQWAILWLVVAAVGCWKNRLRPATSEFMEGKRRQIAGWMDRAAVWMIVAGVWISTASVFQREADRRAALNVAFEWTAILAASVLFWQWAARSFRQRMGTVLIGIGMGAAVMGIVQHHVVWEQRAEWYLSRVSAIEEWRQTGIGAAEAAAAEAEFRASQVPLEGAAQQSFRRRLLDSTEAIGPFALANTLGGFLAAALVLLLGAIWNGVRHSLPETPKGKSLIMPLGWGGLIWAGVIWAGVIGYALVLTKSRTAWVGVVVGTVWLMVATAKGGSAGTGKRRAAVKPVLIFGVSLSVLVGVLFAAGILSGAIDREVLLESPRSLRFRLMYWIGTLDVLKAGWLSGTGLSGIGLFGTGLFGTGLFGTGPGNFRNAYLQHKLPEASEQILDPHNLLLDTYCCAGLLGFLGLLMLLFGGLRRGANLSDSPSSPAASSSAASSVAASSVAASSPATSSIVVRKKSGVATAALISALLFVTWHWLTGADVAAELMQLPDGGLLVLAIPMCVVVVAISFPTVLRVDRTVFQASFVALIVHLMGAGAFQISAVGLLLVCLHRGSCGDSSLESGDVQSTAEGDRWQPFFRRSTVAGFGVVAFAGLAVTVEIWGLIPVRAADQAMAASRVAEGVGRRELAVLALDEGIQADGFNVNLRQRKAEVLTYAVMASGVERAGSAPILEDREQRCRAALSACQRWRASDVTGYREFVVRSQVLEAWWAVTKKIDLLEKAVKAMELAVEHDPTSAEVLSRLALLQNKAGMIAESKKSVSAALGQDEINREWGHAELYLSDSLIEQLQTILQ